MTSKIRRESRFSRRGRDSSTQRPKYFAKVLDRQGKGRGAGNPPVLKPLKVLISAQAADLSKVHRSPFTTCYILFKFQLASQRGKNVASEFRLLRTNRANLSMHSCSERQAGDCCVFRCKYQKLLTLPHANTYLCCNFKAIFPPQWEFSYFTRLLLPSESEVLTTWNIVLLSFPSHPWLHFSLPNDGYWKCMNMGS